MYCVKITTLLFSAWWPHGWGGNNFYDHDQQGYQHTLHSDHHDEGYNSFGSEYFGHPWGHHGGWGPHWGWGW